MRLLSLALLLPAALVAQSGQRPTCDAAEFRQFDYWVGEWTVHDTTGTQIAESSIRRAASGCAIAEEWRPTGGQVGVSHSWYEPNDGRWHQQWISAGWNARFTGGLEDGVMVLVSVADPATPGAPITRMRYTQPRKDVVLQTLHTSNDGGKSWAPSFVGEYRRKH